MLIYKKLNNNAIISKDENHKEIVVMGKGIAFKIFMMKLMKSSLLVFMP